MADGVAPGATEAAEGEWTDRSLAFLRAHVVDIIFGLLVAFSAFYWTRITRGSYFFLDDWLLLRQAADGEFLGPYNEHLSVIILALWQASFEIAGLDYRPIQAAGIISLVLVSVSLYVVIRSKFGPLLAAGVATLTLWTATADLSPQNLNHYLVLCCAAACALALDRGPRADIVLLLATAISLASAGGGVAVVAACLVHDACTRASLRRWLATLIPAGLWTVWYLAFSNSDRAGGSDDSLLQQIPDSILYTRDLMYDAFNGLLFGVSQLAVVLIVVYLAFGVWLVTKGLVHAANYLAWSSAMLVWGFGLTLSRGELLVAASLFDPEFVFRYSLTPAVFMILALMPRKRMSWDWLPAMSPPLRRMAGVGLIVALVLLMAGRVVTLRSEYQEKAEVSVRIGRGARTNLLLAAAGPEVLPDARQLPISMGLLTAGQLRQLLEDNGLNPPATASELDQRLVDEGLIEEWVMTEGERTCGLGSRLNQVNGLGVIRLWSDEPTWQIDVRGVGDEWIPLTEGTAGQVIQVRFPTVEFDIPWEVRAEGACTVKE